MRLLKLIFCVFVLLFSMSDSFAQELVSGNNAFTSTCNGTGLIYATTPTVLGKSCVVAINVHEQNASTNLFKYSWALGTCTQNSCSTTILDPTHANCAAYVKTTMPGSSAADIAAAVTAQCGAVVAGFLYPAFIAITRGTVPTGVYCHDGAYDAQNAGCLGYPLQCQSGLNVKFALKSCATSSMVNGVCKDKNGVSNGYIPPNGAAAAYEGCHYVFTSSASNLGDCYSVDDGNTYCDWIFTSDGSLAKGTDAFDTPSTVEFAQSCDLNPSAVNCGGSGPNAPTDGTTGGTGSTTCGNSAGLPSCANGAATGFTACGGTGQPVCSAGNSSSSANAVQCGGAGMPPCNVNIVSGSSGSSSPATNPTVICGGLGLPACTSTDSVLDNFFSGANTPNVDPVPATLAQLNAAGLDGGSTFKSLASFQLPAHTSTCPTATFSLWGKSFVMDAQCSLASSVLSYVQTAMLVAWSLLALFIVMKA